MAITDSRLTLREAHEYLQLNGVDWSFGWLKIQVNLGRIPSEKIFNSRVVERTAIDKIIKEKRAA